MKKLILTFQFVLIYLCSFAQPGKDGAVTISAANQILNHYIPVSANIPAGSNTVALASASLFSICPGDLIMIYQAQGATTNTTNTNSYGTITSYNSAGLYEFKYVQSVSGNIVTTQTTFTNSYAVAGRVQLIKVPQYTTLAINAVASVIPKPWKDTIIAATAYRFGGLVVIHASNINNNGTINAAGSGFRGGALFLSSGLNLGNSAFTSTLNSQGGEKGESIFGYQVDYDNNGGRYCMGAPANGGGGGDGHNAGGGGGANGNNGNTWSGQGVMITNISNPITAWSLSAGYVANGNALTTSSGGGHGGYSYGDANANATIQGPGNPSWIGDTRREVGGIGGRPLTNINSETRIYFGGGGGSAHADNNATTGGANGGGIVYLIATTGITGNGTISSNGNSVPNSTGCNCDGLSGAGAGGSIVIKNTAIAITQNVTANGGIGGSQMFPVFPSNPNESEGPGGGGGGGFAAIANGAVVPLVNGGSNGSTLSNAVANEMTFNGSTTGAVGQTMPVTTNFVSFIPLSNPTVTATNNGPVCAGSPLILTTTVNALSYSWTGPNTSSSSAQSYTITNPSLSASGIYSVQFNFGGCSLPATATTQVLVNSSPTITVTGATVCTGQVIVLNPSVSSATAYAWTGPNGFNATTQNISITNPAINMAGTYSLVATNAGGCTATASVNVSVTPTPTLTLLNNSPLCAGATLNFTTTGATNYTLSGPNSFSSTLQNPSIANITSANAGVYTLLASNANCLASVNTNIIISPAPTPGIINNSPANICAGQAIGLNGSGGTSYQWSGPAAFTSTLQNITVNPATIANSGSYTLTVFSVNGCSAAIASPVITVNTIPSISVSGASVCINQPVTLTCNSSAASFLWSGPNSFTSTSQSINFSNANFNLSGIYSVTVTSAQGCTNSAVATVTVVPVPSPGISSNGPVCAGSTLNFTGSGGASYSYSGPNGFTSVLQNPSITNVTNAAAGIYTLTASNFGCAASATLSVSILGSGGGIVSTSKDKLCIPFCSDLSVNATNSSIVSSSISVNGQMYLGNNLNYCIATAGNYTVNSIFKDTDGCINTATLLITAYAPPVAGFEFSPIKPVENTDNVLFTNTSIGEAQTNWNWFFMNNSGYTSSNQNTFFLFETAGNYPVAMIVKNQWGCSDTIVKVITVGEDFSFYIPNTFTPNGDGLNDVFLPKGHGIIKYQMDIFDRWGEKIFSTKEFSVGWDGTFKGKKCEVDTYTWKIILSDPAGRAKEFTGHVNIIE